MLKSGEEKKLEPVWVGFPINESMTALVTASTSVSGGGETTGEVGGGRTGFGGGGCNNANALLGSNSREAFHKIVSSHTSTQVDVVCAVGKAGELPNALHWIALDWLYQTKMRKRHLRWM